jgi:hypothetical protein
MSMQPDLAAVEALEAELEPQTRQRIDTVVERIVQANERGGRVVVVTGSGPNIHEGVTTLIAELMRLGIIDGVTTSSAVVAHEMGGVLEEVKRVDGRSVGLPESLLPLGGTFELTLLTEKLLTEITAEMPVDGDLIERLRQAAGDVIIKAAGNLSYPVGLWIERVTGEILARAKIDGVPFETVAGRGADPRTMVGQGARRGIPVLVTIPQLVGGGAVGLAIGDSISITERSGRLARMLAGADVIIESAVALTQEIHDGPLETHTGHGLWAAWQGHPTYSLEGKTLVRIDLDPTLETVWQAERNDAAVQRAINSGQPKTKSLQVPFRMEMSGFARLAGSIALCTDIGVAWPIIAHRVTERLGLSLEFISHPQQTPQGQAMREWIVRAIAPLSHARLMRSGASVSAESE